MWGGPGSRNLMTTVEQKCTLLTLLRVSLGFHRPVLEKGLAQKRKTPVANGH